MAKRKIICLITFFLLAVHLAFAASAAEESRNTLEGENGIMEEKYLLTEAEYPAGFSTPFRSENGMIGEIDEETWWQAIEAKENAVIQDCDKIFEFCRKTALSMSEENVQENFLYSPVNLWLCINMLSHLTTGDSQAQLFELLGAESAAEQNGQLANVYLSMYRNDEKASCVPGASLWLNEGTGITREATEILRTLDHASVFCGRMGDESYDEAMHSWLNRQTNGLLEKSIRNLRFSENAELSVCTTLYFKSGWSDPFSPENTVPGTFHADSGEVETLFMHRSHTDTVYRGENFTAVILDMMDGSQMFFLLPDEGINPEDLLCDQEALCFLREGKASDNIMTSMVNLATPKIDCLAELQLTDMLESLGVTDVFHPDKADFSAAVTSDREVSVSDLQQHIRLVMDEEGIEAASFTISDVLGMLIPSEEIDLVLDRPFLYILETDRNLPLFMGIMREP